MNSRLSSKLFVQANNIPKLDFDCVPCVSFGGYYCYDNPWEINQRADKCYEYAVDRLNCDGFNFTNNMDNCTGNIIASGG